MTPRTRIRGSFAIALGDGKMSLHDLTMLYATLDDAPEFAPITFRNAGNVHATVDIRVR